MADLLLVVDTNENFDDIVVHKSGRLHRLSTVHLHLLCPRQPGCGATAKVDDHSSG